MIWHDKVIHFGDRSTLAKVSYADDITEVEAIIARQQVLPAVQLTFLYRVPPVNLGEPVDSTETGAPIYQPTLAPMEMWQIAGFDVFDTIRLAGSYFGQPAPDRWKGGAGASENLVRDLRAIFNDGSFAMRHLNDAIMTFSFVDSARKISRTERKAVDELNSEYFRPDASGMRMKQSNLSPPNGFVLGSA